MNCSAFLRGDGNWNWLRLSIPFWRSFARSQEQLLLFLISCGERGILALASDFVDYEPPLGCSHPL